MALSKRLSGIEKAFYNVHGMKLSLDIVPLVKKVSPDIIVNGVVSERFKFT